MTTADTHLPCNELTHCALARARSWFCRCGQRTQHCGDVPRWLQRIINQKVSGPVTAHKLVHAPVGLNLMLLSGYSAFCMARVTKQCPVDTSHSLSRPSKLQLASTVPSGW